VVQIDGIQMPLKNHKQLLAHRAALEAHQIKTSIHKILACKGNAGVTSTSATTEAASGTDTTR
jgi:hypothetical protein